MEQNEAKTDAKIDMLHQFGALNQKNSKSRLFEGDTSFESGYTGGDTTEGEITSFAVSHDIPM